MLFLRENTTNESITNALYVGHTQTMNFYNKVVFPKINH